MTAINTTATTAPMTRRDGTTAAATLVAAFIFGFVALVLTALLIGLMVAVSLADTGRITVKPGDLAAARDALSLGWLIALGAVINIAGLIGAIYATRAGTAVATVVAGTGLALATALFIGTLVNGADPNGLGISLAKMGAYAVALASTMILRTRRPA